MNEYKIFYFSCNTKIRKLYSTILFKNSPYLITFKQASLYVHKCLLRIFSLRINQPLSKYNKSLIYLEIKNQNFLLKLLTPMTFKRI